MRQWFHHVGHSRLILIDLKTNEIRSKSTRNILTSSSSFALLTSAGADAGVGAGGLEFKENCAGAGAGADTGAGAGVGAGGLVLKENCAGAGGPC